MPSRFSFRPIDDDCSEDHHHVDDDEYVADSDGIDGVGTTTTTTRRHQQQQQQQPQRTHTSAGKFLSQRIKLFGGQQQQQQHASLVSPHSTTNTTTPTSPPTTSSMNDTTRGCSTPTNCSSSPVHAVSPTNSPTSPDSTNSSSGGGDGRNGLDDTNDSSTTTYDDVSAHVIMEEENQPTTIQKKFSLMSPRRFSRFGRRSSLSGLPGTKSETNNLPEQRNRSRSTDSITSSMRTRNDSRGRKKRLNQKEGSKSIITRSSSSSNNNKINRKTYMGSTIIEDNDEDDPVMVLFEARTTQRVRFSLDQEPEELSNGKHTYNDNEYTSSSSSSPASLLRHVNHNDASHKGGVPGSPSHSNSSSLRSTTPSFNIKKFMKGALFGGTSKNMESKTEMEEFEKELAQEIKNATNSVVNNDETKNTTTEQPLPVDGNHIHTNLDLMNESPSRAGSRTNKAGGHGEFDNDDDDDIRPFLTSFEEDAATRATFLKLLNKARRAQFIYYRYQYAVRTYIKALELLRKAHYPDQHPTVVKTMKNLNNAHFAVSSLKNSANIVKLGIRYEDSGELVRALKMYTIAYRIRRDTLSATHPSLVVLLNMLGSIQVKRGELNEAMAIYELALKDSNPVPQHYYYQQLNQQNHNITLNMDDTGKRDGENSSGGSSSISSSMGIPPPLPPPEAGVGISQYVIPIGNFMTRSVAYREMGTIYQQWGDIDKALENYHLSLECMAHYKGIADQYQSPKNPPFCSNFNGNSNTITNSNNNNTNTNSNNHVNDNANTTGNKGGWGTGFFGFPSSSSNTTTNVPAAAAAGYDVNDIRNKNGGINTDELVDEGKNTTNNNPFDPQEGESAGMELTFKETRFARFEAFSPRRVGAAGRLLKKKVENDHHPVGPCSYDVFFPLSLEKKEKMKKGKKSKNNVTEEKKGDYVDVEIAQTIHRIAQLHRSVEQYEIALPIFNVSLRGMKYALGKTHPNVAAILGNIGNLQKEMGDMDASYQTYQQVLAIESYRLGLSHPDVVITLHNIATIDAGRGNNDHALSLYTQVLSLQRKLFGEDHESVAVTSACMGDVYERTGDSHAALECYEEALRIKISSLGRHSLEVARLLHKLGKLAVAVLDYHLALSYLSKAALVYRLNKLRDDDEWVVDVTRDSADVEASIAMGRGVYFEC